ncbi:mechanosensitive ion channel family protein [Aureispira]|nr:mechanosensitive ion channel family protein [Aureispira sp.]
MDLSINNIPYSTIAVFIAVGFSLQFFFKLVNNQVIPFLQQKQKTTYKWWQRIKILAWLLYSFLFFVALLSANIIVTLFLSVIVLGLGWNYWRNIFSGILIKFSSQFRKGDIISTEFAKGALKTINLSHTKLLNEQGELVVIPNFILRNAVLKQLYKKRNIKTHSFKITTDDSCQKDRIYQLVLNCPYISVHQEISIKKLQKNVFLLKVSIIDIAFVEKIHEYFSIAKGDIQVSY